ncbi:MAG: hypothetical protein K8T91_00295, partial [Planctomycetes bacterium]|nr:hypothetical protein [Planctomycetota bacterium]
MVGSLPPAAEPPRRVVVLGASNLAISLPTVVSAAQAVLGGPLEILATPGHGRSYGLSTAFLRRRLPGIVSCGLWDDLARRPAASTVALITDIGNDLVYDASIDQIIDWVGTCLRRLDAVGARVVMTRLPLESLQRTPPHRYWLLRKLFFPANRTPLDTMLDRAEQLNRQVDALGRQGWAALVDLPGAWYGFDPIHIRRSMRATAWRTILAPLGSAESSPLSSTMTWRQRVSLRRFKPLERTVGGVVQIHPQPAGILADG